MEKILIIEDDLTIAKALSAHLESWGYDVLYLHEFQAVADEVAAQNPQLVILDIYLPYFNGYHWCQEIRKTSKVPILFLSSASDGMNLVLAMNMGGDDFIAKPFDLNVLTAKVQALLRRAYDYASPVSTVFTLGPVTLNTADATLSCKAGKTELTRNELRILQILLENAGHIVSRESIMQFLWDSEHFIDDNTLTVNITRLRKKLDDIGLSDLIKTKKGLGYLIDKS